MSTIIIAHLHPVIRGLIEEHLCNQGYTVVSTTSGLKAFVNARLEQPRMVITDTVLLDRSGLSLTRQLRRHWGGQALPILFVTEHGHFAQAAQRAGANAYLHMNLRKDTLTSGSPTAQELLEWHEVVTQIHKLLAA